MTYDEFKQENKAWWQDYFPKLKAEKERILNEIIEDRIQILENSNVDKLNYLVKNIFELSVFKDNRTYDILESIGIGKLVTKFFVDAEVIFHSLEKHYDKSIYRFPIKGIWIYYKALSQVFFFKQLVHELGLDFDKELDKLRRQEKNGNVSEAILEDLNKLGQNYIELKEEIPELRLMVSDKYISSTLRKVVNKPHKTVLFNLLITIQEFSLASPIDYKDLDKFYARFYDLMEILSRDLTYLWDDTKDRDVRSKYDSDDSFKAKRVKSLLKLKGYQKAK
ncbi:hypothetical protein [Winogradskyella aquimaris]|uniref:CHAD domain-containing protein n=1 Tax=Winogradskyella aquimaris TaxID=864074 RepID=A0ABU5EQ14_9FLAO|nr:hypothetical protein [Winogradskyella aquimaris]MDY2588214.1 hypothetical protein [Winogradskyella aquimaris]